MIIMAMFFQRQHGSPAVSLQILFTSDLASYLLLRGITKTGTKTPSCQALTILILLILIPSSGHPVQIPFGPENILTIIKCDV